MIVSRKLVTRVGRTVAIAMVTSLLVMTPLGCKRVDTKARAGHALLDEYVEILAMIVEGNTGRETLEHLERRVQRAGRYRQRGTVLRPFALRYQQMLTVTIYMILPRKELSPKAKASIRQFLEKIARTRANEQHSDLGKLDLEKLGPALAHEILSLRMLLDHSDDRAMTHKKYSHDPV